MFIQIGTQVFRIRKSRAITNAINALWRAPLCNHCAYFGVLRLRNALWDTRRDAERKGRSSRRLRAATVALEAILKDWRESPDYSPPEWLDGLPEGWDEFVGAHGVRWS